MMPAMPPETLRFRVAGMTDANEFDEFRKHSVVDLTRALAGRGRTLASFDRILDWGCGCGRVLRHIVSKPH